MPKKIDLIILHCSDNPNPKTDIADIRAYHTAPKPKGKGWRDVGYHWFIRSDGLLQRGREVDGDPFMEAEEIGAHCQGFNSRAIGICLNGRKEFAPIQFETLKSLLQVVCFTRWPSATLHGHCEYSLDGKTCPNFDVEPHRIWWEALKITHQV